MLVPDAEPGGTSAGSRLGPAPHTRIHTRHTQTPGRLARLHADEDNNEDNNDDK